jgi:aldose 1-epimerase
MSVQRAGMLLFVILTLMNLKTSANPGSKPSIATHPFGAISTGQKTDLYVLTNSRGMTVAITDYGATVVSIKVPDRSGHADDVVLGFDSAKE